MHIETFDLSRFFDKWAVVNNLKYINLIKCYKYLYLYFDGILSELSGLVLNNVLITILFLTACTTRYLTYTTVSDYEYLCFFLFITKMVLSFNI